MKTFKIKTEIVCGKIEHEKKKGFLSLNDQKRAQYLLCGTTAFKKKTIRMKKTNILFILNLSKLNYGTQTFSPEGLKLKLNGGPRAKNTHLLYC